MLDFQCSALLSCNAQLGLGRRLKKRRAKCAHCDQTLTRRSPFRYRRRVRYKQGSAKYGKAKVTKMRDTSRKTQGMYWYARRVLYVKLALGGFLGVLAVAVYFLAR